MKLYTEEQVKQIQQAILCNHKDAIMDDNYCLNVTKPIELPSDEEIDNHVEDDFINATMAHKYIEEAQLLMKAMCKAGMKSMRDKIQGGNNEQ